MTQNITIRRTKINSKGGLDVTYVDKKANEITVKSLFPVNNNIAIALDELKPFFAYLTEQKESNDIDWEHLEDNSYHTLLKPLHVTGVKITPNSEGGDMVVLYGCRTLINDKGIAFSTSTLDMETLRYDWPMASAFDAKLQILLTEVEDYINTATDCATH